MIKNPSTSWSWTCGALPRSPIISTQVDAIADGIGHALAQEGHKPSHIEGMPPSTWVLMDYGDVVVHIFDEHTRTYYSLERLWGDAPSIPLRLTAPVLKGAKP
jgi:ribosomal silencing factor RsfS